MIGMDMGRMLLLSSVVELSGSLGLRLFML
jgi:hypothetical protein